jgi:membrane protein implicated in regulation of membrane protease activity
VKALLPVGIVLIVIGLFGGFGYQVIVAVSTGLPTSGIGWLQTTGFVVAAGGAILIGAYIGRRRKQRRDADSGTVRR